MNRVKFCFDNSRFPDTEPQVQALATASNCDIEICLAQPRGLLRCAQGIFGDIHQLAEAPLVVYEAKLPSQQQ